MKTQEERLLGLVSPIPFCGCWIPNKDHMYWNGVHNVIAHDAFFECFIGDIIEIGYSAVSTCGLYECVNPQHASLVSADDAKLLRKKRLIEAAARTNLLRPLELKIEAGKKLKAFHMATTTAEQRSAQAKKAGAASIAGLSKDQLKERMMAANAAMSKETRSRIGKENFKNIANMSFEERSKRQKRAWETRRNKQKSVF